METIELKRTFATHIDNVTAGTTGLIETELSWVATDPLLITTRFVSDEEGIEDVKWELGVSFFEDALTSGRAGHPLASPALAELSGDDFVLTLRGIERFGGFVSISKATWDLEQVRIFVQQVQHLSEELTFTIDTDQFFTEQS